MSERGALIIPARDEVLRIEAVVKAGLETNPGLIGPDRVVVVDNGSRDGTGELARALGVTVLDCALEGKGHAMREGADFAINELGATVLTFADADAIGLVPEHLDALTALVLADLTPMATGYLGERPAFLQSILRHWSGFSGFRAVDVERVWRYLQDSDFEGWRIEGALNAICRNQDIHDEIIRGRLIGVSHVGQMEKQASRRRGLLQYFHIYRSAIRGLMSQSGRVSLSRK
jgi:glycosyltransferase involved in cell wall biosynthesis